MPEEAGLGTHLTLTLDGGAKFGPDSEWIAWDPDEGPDYAVDPARGEKFYAGQARCLQSECLTSLQCAAPVTHVQQPLFRLRIPTCMTAPS